MLGSSTFRQIKTSRIKTKWRKTFFLCLVLFLISSPAVAMPNSKNIKMDYVLGFNSTYKPGCWTPLSITLENKGASLTGTLEVTIKEGSEYKENIYHTTYSVLVDLPSGTKKKFHFTVLIKSFLHPMMIRFKNQEQVLVSEECNLRNSATQKSLLLIVKNGFSTVFFTSMPEQYRIVLSNAEHLPRTWYGYDGASKVIMDPSMFQKLDNQQFEALDKWIQNGGTLITSGSMNYGIFSNKRVQALLGVSVFGLINMPKIPSLKAFCSRAFISSDDFLVNKAQMEKAKILVSEQQTPIVFQKEKGDGQILFIAFDINNPLFLQWGGQKKFWQKVVSLNEDSPFALLIPNDDKILEKMFENPPDTIPGYTLIIPSLICYIILLTIFLKLKNPLVKKELIKIGCLMITIFIFSGAAVVFFRQPIDLRSQVSILRIKQNQKKLIYDNYTGLYSLKKKKVSILLKSNNDPVQSVYPNNQDQDRFLPLNIHEVNDQKYLQIAMDRWSTFYFKTSTHLKSGYRYKINRDNKNLIVTFENYSDKPINNCLLYYNDRFIPIGNLPADTTITRRVLSAELTPKMTFTNQDAHLLIDAFLKNHKNNFQFKFTRDILPPLLDSIHAFYGKATDKMFLIGSVGNNISKLNKQKAQLVFWEIVTEPKTPVKRRVTAG